MTGPKSFEIPFFHRSLEPFADSMQSLSTIACAATPDSRFGNDIHKLPWYKVNGGKSGSCRPRVKGVNSKIGYTHTNSYVGVWRHREFFDDSFWWDTGLLEMTKHLLCRRLFWSIRRCHLDGMILCVISANGFYIRSDLTILQLCAKGWVRSTRRA